MKLCETTYFEGEALARRWRPSFMLGGGAGALPGAPLAGASSRAAGSRRHVRGMNDGADEDDGGHASERTCFLPSSTSGRGFGGGGLACYRARDIEVTQSARCKAIMGFVLRLHSPLVLLCLTFFLVLVMLRFDDTHKLLAEDVSWSLVFIPLWVASGVGMLCTSYRLWGQDISARPRSYVIEQLNSLIFWVTTCAVLVLIALYRSFRTHIRDE